MTTPHEARADALAFLKRHKIGVLATISRGGLPQARTVYYVCDDEFNIYFVTLVTSRKFDAIAAHSEVAFTVTTQDIPQTLQIEGRAMDITHDEIAAAKKEALFSILNSDQHFYPPISKLDPAETAVLWLQPTWMRWADYAFARNGTDNVWREISADQK